MNAIEKLRFIEEIMDVPSGSLTSETGLEDLEAWDSMSVLGFITEMRVRYDITVSINQIKALKTVGELCSLIPD